MGDRRDSGSDPSEAFAARLSSELEASGMALADLQGRLLERGETVSLATLSYWRSGGRRPEGPRSAMIVRSIEQILGLPEGALADAVEPRPRIGKVAAPRIDASDPRYERMTMETLALMGVTSIGDDRSLTAHLIASVAANRVDGTLALRELRQAVRDDVRAIPIVHIIPGNVGRVPEVGDLFGLSLAQSVAHPGGEAFGYLLEYDRPLHAGDTALVEYSIRTPMTHRLAAYYAHTALREVLVSARFAPGAEPQWIEGASGEVANPRPIPLQRDPGGASALVTRKDFGPGVLAIRWDYDD